MQVTNALTKDVIGQLELKTQIGDIIPLHVGIAKGAKTCVAKMRVVKQLSVVVVPAVGGKMEGVMRPRS